MATHRPLGLDNSWKTGQRVPADGHYVDQYGYVSWHEKGGTFPPCIDRDGECAFRKEYVQAAATA